MFPDQDLDGIEIAAAGPQAVVEEPTVWIPLADGTRLAARLWRPVGAEAAPVPAIVETIPYRRRDGTLAVDERSHPFFAAHGYACLRIDIRGSGDSTGSLADEYLTREQDDVLEVIDWLAAQPWCDGRVGMIGLSWGGFASLQVAARAPAALKAVIAIGATVDRYNDDVHYKNGCLLNENFGWASSFLSFSTRPPDPAVVGDAKGGTWRALWLERLEALRFFAAPWFAHQARDAYWKHGSVGEDPGAIACPVMIVTGWGDLYVNALPRLLESLRVPCRAIAGPWAHHFPHLASPGPALDFLGEALAWWDRWLKGDAARDPAERSYLAYCLEGSSPDPWAKTMPGEWLEAKAWPHPGSAEHSYFLTAEGLAEAEGPAPRRVIRSPLDNGTAFGELVPHCYGPEMAQDQRGDDAGDLTFDSPPLEQPLSIWGDAVVEVSLSGDCPSGQLIVRLCDVGPDGGSERVTYGVLNLKHRHGNAEPSDVVPGEVMRLRVALDQVAHRFPAGHRIRLALGTACWPAIWPAADDPVLTLAPVPARLILPVYEGNERANPAPPRAPPPPRMAVLRPPANQRRVERDLAAGTTRLEILDDYGRVEYLGNGMINGAVKRETYAIAWDDPCSARADYHWTQELARGDWAVRSETVTQLTCDSTHYHLSAKVTAYESEGGGDLEVFARAWNTSIERR